jgi:branched-subunit amino acid ABC-type transport system permease component
MIKIVLTYYMRIKRFLNSIVVGFGIFLAAFLVPVIGGIISIPMSLIGAWMYYDHSK